VHWRGCTDDGSKYALTFDDGPTEPSTSSILDTLGELGVRATFFVIGQNVQKYPRLVERMHAEGHLVENHSYDHSHVGMLRGFGYWRKQLQQTREVIEPIIAVRTRLFRPPMGVRSWFICGAARSTGHAIVTWSRRGFDGTRTTVPQILDRLVPNTKGGDVLALHDGIEPRHTRDPSSSVAAIKPLILGLRSRGLEPAPLDELLRLPAYESSPIADAAAIPSAAD
jgi:peptidoglycan/xylan/chitin deacetylase (PgdA/CDA1 family)